MTTEHLIDREAHRKPSFIKGAHLNWLKTYTGKSFYPALPDPELICIEDIAHALSNICRFAGHCRDFLSVSEHTQNVYLDIAQRTSDKDLWKTAFLHDATEAYVIDLPSPIKNMCENYREIERRVADAITERFNLKYPIDPHHPMIKESDIRVFKTERLELFDKPKIGEKDWCMGIRPADVKIRCLPPKEAKGSFLKHAKELGLL